METDGDRDRPAPAPSGVTGDEGGGNRKRVDPFALFFGIALAFAAAAGALLFIDNDSSASSCSNLGYGYGYGYGYGGYGYGYGQPCPVGTGSMSGTVTQGDTDAPLQFATITVSDASNTWTAITAVDGSYIVTDLPAATFTVTVSASGHQTRWYVDSPDAAGATSVTLGNGEAKTGIDVVLPVTSPAIVGTVTDSVTHAPVANVCVYASIPPIPGGPAPPVFAGPIECAGGRTGPTGKYAVPVTPGAYNLQIVDPQQRYLTEWYQDQPSSATATPVVVSDAGATADVELDLGGRITGSIRDANTSAPLVAKTVWIVAPDNLASPVAITLSNPDGTYHTGPLPAGSYLVHALPNGDQTYVGEWFDDAATSDTATPVDVTVGNDHGNVDFSLAVGGRIVGSVVDQDTNSPISFFTVSVFDAATGNPVTTTTGGFGSFSTSALPTGVDYVFGASTAVPNSFVPGQPGSDGHLAEYYDDAYTFDDAQPITLSAGANGPFVVDLARTPKITGSVVDDVTGLPIVFDTVFFQDSTTGAFVGSTFTDSNGNFSSEFSSLPPGTFKVVVFSFNLPYNGEYYNDVPDFASATPITLTPGGTDVHLLFGLTSILPPTITTISDTPDPTVVGQNYTVQFTVTGGGAPTGNVRITDGDNSCLVDVSVGSCSFQSISPGTKSVKAVYLGDQSFAPSAATTAHLVNKASTSVTILGDAPDPSVVGQQFAVQWSVAANAPGGGLPTGTVTVSGTGIDGCFVGLADGQCTVTGTVSGTRNFTVTYSGDDKFNGSAKIESHVATKGPQSISFDPLPDRTYGENFTAFATATSGLPVSFSSLTPTTCITSGANGVNIKPTGVGTCTLRASQGGNGSWLAAPPVDQSFTVNKATLTVTADNKSKVYGTNLPPLTVTYSGFVNGDNKASSGILGAPACSTTATTTSDGGQYPITCTSGTLSSPKYAFNLVDGTLTITKKTVTGKPTDAVRVYGAPDPAFVVNYGGFALGQTFATSGITGAASCTSAAGPASPVGSYTISCTDGTLSSANYAFTFTHATLKVTPARLTITADNQNKVHGAPNPPLTFSPAVLPPTVTGAPSCTTTAKTTSPAGTYPIVCTKGSLASPNYTFVFVAGTMTVT